MVDLDVVLLYLRVDALLEPPELGDCEAVGLGDDGDQVDLVLETSEELEVNLAESVTVRRDKVEAAVHPRVNDVLPVEAALSLKRVLCFRLGQGGLIQIYIQGELTGFNIGNGEKLSNNQAEEARHHGWQLLSFYPLPVLNPASSP